MRTIPAALVTHYGQETTTLAKLWRVTLAAGSPTVVYGFTDHDADITYDGTVYEAASGFTASAARATLGLAADNMEIGGALKSDAITEADLRAGVWDFATVELWEINWASPSDGVQVLATGTLGEVKLRRGQFSVEILGLSKRLGQTIGRSIMPACDADLGDARCGVNLNASPGYYATGTVTAAMSNREFRCAALAGYAADYFTFGKITWTSGANAGRSMEVKGFNYGSPTEGRVELQLAMPSTVAAGDGFSMHAGCDKSLTTCNTKFSNTINFRGFPYLPGIDRLLLYPNAH